MSNKFVLVRNVISEREIPSASVSAKMKFYLRSASRRADVNYESGDVEFDLHAKKALTFSSEQDARDFARLIVGGGKDFVIPEMVEM